MEVKQLFTLSQFIDDQKKRLELDTGVTSHELISASNVDKWNTYTIHTFGRIIKYNNFLKQPLNKEMFVNEIQEPHIIHGNEQYYGSEMDQWQKAERKVMFEDVKILNFDNSYTVTINGYALFYKSDDSDIKFNFKSLHELAQVTEGKLKLKNVAI